MEKLFIKCKNIIKSNISKELDEDLIDILSVAIMGLMLFNQELTEKYLVNSLKELDIYFGKESVLEMSHKYLNNYSEDEHLKNSDAAFTHLFSLNDKEQNINIENEKLYLIVSLKNINNKNIIDIIAKIIHEFLHCMRFKGYNINNREIVVKDGIGIAYYNNDTNNLKRKHMNLEEGIVDKYTEDVINILKEYIKDNNYSIPILNKTKKDLINYKYDKSYTLNRFIINQLCRSQRFNELLLESFNEKTTPSKLSLYFDSVMETSGAFTVFSRKLDQLFNSLDDEKKCKRLTQEINCILHSFEFKSKNNILRKKL